MYDLLGSPYDVESPAIDDEDVALPIFGLPLPAAISELPMLPTDPAGNISASLIGACALLETVEMVRLRLKNRPDIS